MNKNQTNTNALVVKCYANTYQVRVDLSNYSSAHAPDQKSRNKVYGVMHSCYDMPHARDLLYAIHMALFSELYDLSWSNKAEHRARADFYRSVAVWARACYNLVKEAPVIVAHPLYGPRPPNDAPSPKDTSMEQASALSSGGEHEYGSASVFWDVCVQISDDLRSDLAEDQIKKASTVAVPEPEVAGAMWEVAGDPDRSLYRTKMDAERAAREIFPDESVSQRYARVQYRNIVSFK